MPPRTRILTICIILLASIAYGQAYVLPELPDGQYILTIQTGRAPTLTSAVTIQPPDLVPEPEPEPEPEPDPTELATLEHVSRTEHQTIPDSPERQLIAVFLATTYRGLAAELRSGAINVPAASEQIDKLRAALPEAWSSWLDATRTTWLTLQNQGIIIPGTWPDAMDAVADGLLTEAEIRELDGAVFGNPLIELLIQMILNQLDSERPIVQFLQQVLPFLIKFIG